MRRHLLTITFAALALGALEPAAAQPLGQGGSLPLTEVMANTKSARRLALVIRVNLLRAGVKADKVTCSAARYPNAWTHLGGARVSPYVCKIGKRELTVTSKRNYFDKAGRRISPRSKDVQKLAAKVTETDISWRWK